MHLTKTQAKIAVRACGKNPTEKQINDAMKDMSMFLGCVKFWLMSTHFFR
jgi:hypothetical protein